MYAFDRDGVLVGVLGDFAAGHPKQYQGAEMPLIESVLSKVPKGSIIISNQAGIDRGYTTLATVQSQFDWLMAQQPNFIAAFFCPNEGQSCWYKIKHPTWKETAYSRYAGTDYFRKPSAGMGQFAEYIMANTITHYVGDLGGNPSYADGRDTDLQFAKNLGCVFIDVQEFAV